MGVLSMDESLGYIKQRIDKCFADVEHSILLSELAVFKNYIEMEEMLIPLLRVDTSNELEMLRQRVESVTNFLEEEKERSILEGKEK